MKPLPQFEGPGEASWRGWWIGRQSMLGPLGLVALLLACVAAAATLWQLAATRQAIARLVPAAVAAAPVAAPHPVLTREQMRAWNVVARQLNMPWARMLDTLEQATPDDVALVAIEPESRDGTVRLLAEAVALEPLLAYAQALRGTGVFAEAALVKHEIQEQDPQRPVRITLLLRLADAGAPK